MLKRTLSASFLIASIALTPSAFALGVDDVAAHCIPLMTATPAEENAIKQKIEAGQDASDIMQAITARYLACLAADVAAREVRTVAAAAALAAEINH